MSVSSPSSCDNDRADENLTSSSSSSSIAEPVALAVADEAAGGLTATAGDRNGRALPELLRLSVAVAAGRADAEAEAGTVAVAAAPVAVEPAVGCSTRRPGPSRFLPADEA